MINIQINLSKYVSIISILCLNTGGRSKRDELGIKLGEEIPQGYVSVHWSIHALDSYVPPRYQHASHEIQST